MLVEQAISTLGVNAKEVAAKRYSRKDDSGSPTEDWSAIVARVVSHVAAAETDPSERSSFHRAMTEIMNGGTSFPTRRVWSTPAEPMANWPPALFSTCPTRYPASCNTP